MRIHTEITEDTESTEMKSSYSAMILKRAARLLAAAERTENVEQLEAIVRDLEKLIRQAKRVELLNLK